MTCVLPYCKAQRVEMINVNKRITNDEVDKVRLNFLRYFNRDIVPLDRV